MPTFEWFYKSDLFESFLRSRTAAGNEDYNIALAIRQTREVETGKPNYLDLVWDDEAQKAVLTYTSHERYMKARADDSALGAYDRKGHRTKTRPARIIKHFVAKEDGRANDVFAQAAQAYLQMAQEGAANVEVICGDLIGKWYDERLYCRCTTTGMHSSCMRYPGYDSERRFDIYKDTAEMAVIICKDCGKLSSRAIVWTDRDTNNKFVDRIYGTETDMQIVQAWARNNGYYCVYGNQRSADRPRNARIAYKGASHYTMDGWHPYFDSVTWCSFCNHLHFGDHVCEKHTHVITRPHMEWDKDLPLPKVRRSLGSCYHCDEHRYENEHGEVVCTNTEWCDFCGTDHCSHDECSIECSECSTRHGINESCPHMIECETCSRWYCSEANDECPDIHPCAICGEESCAQCEDCYTRCSSCYSWRPNGEDFCTHCQCQCATCGTIQDIYPARYNNGRCLTCFDIVVRNTYREFMDDILPRANPARAMLGVALESSRFADYHTPEYTMYRNLDYLRSSYGYTHAGAENFWAGVTNYTDRLIESSGVAPYLVTLPLNVQHDLWLERNTRPEA